ncbi:hypothetical protein BC938DRAFT_476203 [Jimgerdemannia flammicorona]|uniref:MHYT domain-containing protein n=1 Tax=Jimgerdemannia flammicorona TaxID=994334 RepID=A0A433QQT1_9FUNG|nr:hypothetical protein BC938DRAFT_476203 [Jimgerdemannia flammicorona]
MGAGSVWSMHFIGNNSLTLGYEEGRFQLVYASGFTLLSLAVSIACMALAFYFVGAAEKVQIKRILLGGFTAGSGICGMHYCGEFAIVFFTVEYQLHYVLASLVIGIAATTTALWIFFELRSRWEGGWYKRTTCAMIMGVAVCGMHYISMVGTRYYIPNKEIPPNPLISPYALVTIMTVIVVSGCAGLVVIAFLGHRGKDLVRKRARQIVLDMVIFDERGKVLVTSDGVLPMEDIDHELFAKSQDDEINVIMHPVFHRLFQTTCDWKTKPNPTELEHPLRTVMTEKQEFSESESHFICKFMDAAQQLSKSLKLSLSEMGILFDSVLNTGTIEDSMPAKHLLGYNQVIETVSVTPDSDETKQSDWALVKVEEAQNHSFQCLKNKGQHLFLVQKIGKGESVQRFTQHGYRFSDPAFISDVMGSKLSVPKDVMVEHFRDMWAYVTTGMNMGDAAEVSQRGGGVFVGLLMIVHGEKGQSEDLQIVVDKTKRYTLPLVEVRGEDVPDSRPALSNSEREYITAIFHKTLLDIAPVRQSPSSATFPSHLVSSHFTRAVEQATQNLINLTKLSQCAASKATLHPSIINLPPFGLTRSASQLLLFTCHVPTAEITSVINNNSDNKLRCIPWPIYESFWRTVSDNAQCESLTRRRVQLVSTVFSLPPPPRPGFRMQQRIGSSGRLVEKLSMDRASDSNIPMDDIFEEVVMEEPHVVTAVNRIFWLKEIVMEMCGIHLR